uniref:Uncharacterized protein n=1 Tax=Anopheles funestus TaxID=62324 RepID=A0A4Y0BVK6_ANOFN
MWSLRTGMSERFRTTARPMCKPASHSWRVSSQLQVRPQQEPVRLHVDCVELDRASIALPSIHWMERGLMGCD